VLGLMALALQGCVPATILKRNVRALVSGPRPVEGRMRDPRRHDARISVTWVGHATVLLQLDDKFILTDPVLTETVGARFSRRLVQVGVAVEDLPPVDVAVVSHLHFDHLSLGSLDLLQGRLRMLCIPEEASVYVPDYPFEVREVPRWQSAELDGLRVTAVPVKHPGFRYGADAAWMTRSATGWVFEYHGLTVYFGGDTAYAREAFTATAARFPSIHLALLPIAPVEPPSFARPTHIDGAEALQAFLDLGAQHMVPIHYDTFAHGVDPPGYAVNVLRQAMASKGIGDERVHVLPIGGQFALGSTAAPREDRPSLP
jgi:L-ascorbate metabolism protein UlaG (beta-lactamase superfamily)